MNYQRGRQRAKKIPGTAIVAAGSRVSIEGVEYALAKAVPLEASTITVVPIAEAVAFANLTGWQRLVWLVTGRLP